MVDSTSSTAAPGSIIAKQDASKASLASSEETFLKLLTTQLKNQDPLSPMDSNAFTAQIVQMTGVEQQLMTNDLLTTLVGMSDGGLTSSVDLIGKSVNTETPTGVLKDGKVDFTYNVPRAATSLKLDVVDAYDKVIRTINPEDLTKGDKAFTWDGKSDDGTAQPAGGTYTLKATASDYTGADIAITTKSVLSGVVTAVASENGQVMLSIGDRKLPLSSVVGVTTPPATQSASTQ
jgi:flagellar basal-body rod modification protein FlgD